MKKIYKLSTVTLSTILSIILFTVPASAHVEVKPDTSITGEEEMYTVRVPDEKDVPTTKVTIKMPVGAEFQQYESLTGWTVSTEKGSDGKVTAVTWTATGEGIQPDQFQLFTFIAKNPDASQKIPWNAYQYYKDDSIVEWTGNEGSDTPHSVTTIQAGAAKDTATPVKEGNTGLQTMTTVASVAALLLSVVALIMSLRRKK